MSVLIKALVAALGYPDAERFEPADAQALRALVAWLECTKVRRGRCTGHITHGMP